MLANVQNDGEPITLLMKLNVKKTCFGLDKFQMVFAVSVRFSFQNNLPFNLIHPFNISQEPGKICRVNKVKICRSSNGKSK